MIDSHACLSRVGAASVLSLGLMLGSAAAQSPSDLLRICAQAVQAGIPPSFDGVAPHGSVGEPGDDYVVRAWENIGSVGYLEFQSLENIHDEVDRIAHECRFPLRDGEADLPLVLTEMTAVLADIGPTNTLEIDETFPHAAFACRADGLPLTLTVKRNSDGTLWIEAWDTTWDLPGC